MTEKREPRRLVASLAREPLVHFLLIGAALFGVERMVRPHRSSEARGPEPAASASSPASSRIVLTAEARKTLIDEFARAYGHPPSPAETEDLLRRWIDEEILYREGLARGFERDDPRVRQRVAQKMSFVIESAVVVPEPTNAELEAWFSAHSATWATSELIDFTQVFVEGNSTASNERASALLAQLKAGAEPANLGDTFPGGRRYRRRKAEDLGESFGPDFAKGIATQKENVWELRLSRFGHHLVRVDRRTPADAPAFATVRDEVKLDWEKAKRASLNAASFAELRKRWTVEQPP